MNLAHQSGRDASSPEKSSATRAAQLLIANRQRTKKINTRQIKKIAEVLLAELQITEAELGVNLVGAREMARINWQFLQHEGPTDVITFNHRDVVTQASRRCVPGSKKTTHRRDACATVIHGELFICVDMAISQAKEFKSSWQAEVVRYVVHGVLHLLGYDDLKPHLRRKMKREENRLVRRLAKRFSLAQLSSAAKLGA
jgi:probable rRNA maturation factor